MNSDKLWLDPLYLEELLSEDEKSIKKSAKDFCNKFLLPRVIEDNRRSYFDKNLYKEFGSMGFLGSTISSFPYTNSFAYARHASSKLFKPCFSNNHPTMSFFVQLLNLESYSR